MKNMIKIDIFDNLVLSGIADDTRSNKALKTHYSAIPVYID